MNNEVLFTPASLLDFLSQIDELADYGISVEEADGTINVVIGDSTYTINVSDAEVVEAPAEVVEEVADINDATYIEVANSDYTQVDDEEIVEGGVLREMLKTLAVGGMVRLTTRMLGKDAAEAILKP